MYDYCSFIWAFFVYTFPLSLLIIFSCNSSFILGITLLLPKAHALVFPPVMSTDKHPLFQWKSLLHPLPWKMVFRLPLWVISHFLTALCCYWEIGSQHKCCSSVGNLSLFPGCRSCFFVPSASVVSLCVYSVRFFLFILLRICWVYWI